MSALAIVAKGIGYQVTGSDVDESFITDSSLAEAGLTSAVGFAPEHLAPSVDLVIAGAAFGDNNPEIQAAQTRHLPIWTYSEALAYLAGHQQLVAVAGTHGKTTTTGLLAYLLMKANYDPSYVIGTGHIAGLPSHGRAGQGDYFIAEADDYKRAPNDPQPKFLDLTPYAAIITSIEFDHPDMYADLEACLTAFKQFAARIKRDGFLVTLAGDPTIKRLIDETNQRVITFGFGAADYQIQRHDNQSFSLATHEQIYGPFKTALAGEHNLLNVAAATVMALQLGLSEQEIAASLPHFAGVERRYELLGQVGDTIVIDDYAHHPTAVQLTLETAKKQYPSRPLWTVFQPHTYSRTKALLKEFGQAFKAADQVIITDIYASARETEKTISTEELVNEIKRHHPTVEYIPQTELKSSLATRVPNGAVVLLMGAGDIYKIGRGWVTEKL